MNETSFLLSFLCRNWGIYPNQGDARAERVKDCSSWTEAIFGSKPEATRRGEEKDCSPSKQRARSPTSGHYAALAHPSSACHRHRSLHLLEKKQLSMTGKTIWVACQCFISVKGEFHHTYSLTFSFKKSKPSGHKDSQSKDWIFTCVCGTSSK